MNEETKEVSLNNNKPRPISKADPVIGTMIAIAGLVFLNVFLEYFGVIAFDNSSDSVIPFLNGSQERFFVTSISLILFLSIVSDIFKFVYQHWTYAMFVIYTVITGIIIFLLVRLHMIDNIWNPNFMQQLLDEGFFTSSDSTMYQITEGVWNFLTEWIFVIIIVGFAIGIISAAIKTFHRRRTKPPRKPVRAEVV